MLKKIFLVILGILLLLQFVPVDKTAPEYDSSKDYFANHQVDGNVKKIVMDACYDCHSYQTKYPWYSNIAPVNFLINNHVKEGREHLNFSLWMEYPNKRKHHKLEECIEEIEKGNMPMKSFTWMHPEAKLSNEQKTILVSYFKEAFNAQPNE
ncbi:MAG: heme-binding domain-containing protein [Saprospiraceae bacterium]